MERESARLLRGPRLVALTRLLLEHPGRLLSLGELAERTGAARSTLSEDLDIVGEALRAEGSGEIESVAGPGGGVRYRVRLSRQKANDAVERMCRDLQSPDRILPGGFLYMSDLIFSPEFAGQVGALFATHFGPVADLVVTVETKGIPLALMTGRALGLPVVTVRQGSRVTEGPALGINYVSGSSRRIQTMTLPRRALSPGMRVLVIDDFMKGGGTARGLMDLMGEFGAEVVGCGVLMDTAQPERKLVEGVFSLLRLDGVDEETRTVRVRPSPAFISSPAFPVLV